MQPRFKYDPSRHAGIKSLRELEVYLHGCGLERPLLELVKMRASQINGCAYCLDMHSKDARAAGESEQRLFALDAWRETSFYSARERAALEWCEALTLIADSHAPDELYDRLRTQFDEAQILNLTLAIVAINGWNRLAIGARAQAGSYQPEQAK